MISLHTQARSLLPSRLAIGCVVGMAIIPAPTHAQPSPVEHLSGRPDLVLYHSQAWGQPGLNTAAHEPSKPAAPLRIGSQSYTNGLGHHANSEFVVWLGGQFKRFETEVGVQPCAGGSVIFRVSADGRVLFESGVIRSGDEAKPVSVAGAGAQELILEALDAGDGLTCDMANWANARLVRDPAAQPAVTGTEVDIAPFAVVRTWDPARKDGTRASRLQPIPADELFLGTPVLPEGDGSYIVPRVADGRGCLGVEWLERRRLQRLEVQYAEGSPVPADAEVQYWEMGYKARPEGGSTWQGEWKPLAGQVTRAGNRWAMWPDWTGKREARTGTLKVR